MAIRTILTEPNPILRQISKPLDKVEKEQQKLTVQESARKRLLAQREKIASL